MLSAEAISVSLIAAVKWAEINFTVDSCREKVKNTDNRDSSTKSFPGSLIFRPWERRCISGIKLLHFPSRQVLHVGNKENMINIFVMAFQQQ